MIIILLLLSDLYIDACLMALKVQVGLFDVVAENNISCDYVRVIMYRVFQVRMVL